MDRLEEHIRSNREDLDMYSPSSGVWRKIRRTIRNRKFHGSNWMSIAAMVVVIIGAALVLNRMGYFLPGRGIAINKSIHELQNTSRLNETEIYYNNLVNSLYTEAKPMLTHNPEIKEELSTDISRLDSICLEIRKDLKDNIANQEVVEALIQNYRIKIQLLEDMLIILKENKNNPEKKKNHEL